MARKKKENSIEYDIGNNIKSEGNVKIKVFNNGKLYRTINKHNSGTIELCKYIRDVIIGEGISVNQPTIIKPCKKGPENTLIPLSNQGSPFVERWRAKDDPNATSATAIIKFNIHWTQLSDGQEIGGFQLFNLSKDKCYAYVILDVPIRVYSKTNIEVQWSIKINYLVQEVNNG